MTQDIVREVLQLLPYPFFAFSTRYQDEINAFAGNWLTQCSFEPRLVAFGLQREAYSYELCRQSGVFAVSLFTKEGAEALQRVVGSRRKRPDKMAQIAYRPGPATGCPILEGAAAWFECRVRQWVQTGGDHDLVIGEVVAAGLERPNTRVQDVLLVSDLGWSYAG
ncbi:MAG: flavin reductase family protein [Bacteroidetes bacterium]|nr:flavin reductase family protein [Rhodothermia bacterium]MCS7154367.1 flavin reductase family protein [Bacteroidota bacterium]MCX7907612.1 flavin reductase family protein [Bacteroidota bacterium]MDW8137742.1 flavin reductase family protein [Bacteroidota bacterium]MDW8286408.1 flavin reductase family protein [Bacteroidota bacterium]